MPASEKRPRRKLPPENETFVLMKSARRCALCFQLDGDVREQVGQIAHLDGNRSNGAIDNLAWLCLRHHSEYDSTTSQHKNYTIPELKTSRNRLYRIIASGKHLKGRTPSLWPNSGYKGLQKAMADIGVRLNERFAMSASKGEAPTLREVLDQGRRLVDGALERLLPPPTHFPRSIHKAMRYSVFGGGKRIRPILCIESARMVAGQLPEGVIDLAAALEMLHTYSLVHDDLPGLDNDDLRRGRLSCHKQFGEAIGILAGNALQTYAFEVLSGLRCSDRAKVRIVNEIGRAIGTIDGMIGGQVADLEAEGMDVDADTLMYIHNSKTGALIAASLSTGAIYADANHEQLALVRQFGRMTGLAFQITDDILDVQEMTAQQVKTEAPHKATYPEVFGLRRSQELATALLDDACAQLLSFGPRREVLTTLARLMVDRAA
jgi:geranylgeranyl diphosphate synthase type II